MQSSFSLSVEKRYYCKCKSGLLIYLHCRTRVIYDRVPNEKNYFEIPAFFMFERGKSRVGKFKPMLNYSTVFPPLRPAL